MAQTGVLVSVSGIIRTLREKGGLSTRDLFADVGGSRRTFFRALSALKEAGVVVKVGEKYYWYEFVEERVYGSAFEAEQALHHSRIIVSGLNYILQRGRYSVEGELRSREEFKERALMHLRTGYPEIYRVYERAEGAREEAFVEERRVRDGIKARLPASLQVAEPEYVAEIIVEDIKEDLTGRAPRFLPRLRVEGGEVRCAPYTLIPSEAYDEPMGAFGELRSFITREESEEGNRGSCGRILNLANRYYNLRQTFEHEIEDLIAMVESGTPLRGRCRLCPKVRISEYKAT